MKQKNSSLTPAQIEQTIRHSAAIRPRETGSQWTSTPKLTAPAAPMPVKTACAVPTGSVRIASDSGETEPAVGLMLCDRATSTRPAASSGSRLTASVPARGPRGRGCRAERVVGLTTGGERGIEAGIDHFSADEGHRLLRHGGVAGEGIPQMTLVVVIRVTQGARPVRAAPRTWVTTNRRPARGIFGQVTRSIHAFSDAGTEKLYTGAAISTTSAATSSPMRRSSAWMVRRMWQRLSPNAVIRTSTVPPG